jgi:hypothetical protein
MAHQLYGRTIFLVTLKQFDRPQLLSDFKCSVKLASADEVKELFNGLYSESPEGRYQLIVRQWYHESGFGDCYIARAVDTNEICGVQWLVTSEHVRRMGIGDRFPLADDEYMSENVYIFTKYRRVGAAIAISNAIREIGQQLGFRRYRYYTDEANIPSLKWGEKDGDLVYERILERHFLFRITRKTLERYDPPIPMKAPQDS